MFAEEEKNKFQSEVEEELLRRKNLAKELFKIVNDVTNRLWEEELYFSEHEEEASKEYRALVEETGETLSNAVRLLEKLRDHDSTEEVTRVIKEKFRLRNISKLN